MTSGLSSPLSKRICINKERRSERVAPKLGVPVNDATAIVASRYFVRLASLHLDGSRYAHVAALALGIPQWNDNRVFQTAGNPAVDG